MSSPTPRRRAKHSGGVVTTTLFTGMVSPSLWQFNLVVPDVPDGNKAVLVEISGDRSQTNALLSIQR